SVPGAWTRSEPDLVGVELLPLQGRGVERQKPHRIVVAAPTVAAEQDEPAIAVEDHRGVISGRRPPGVGELEPARLAIQSKLPELVRARLVERDAPAEQQHAITDRVVDRTHAAPERR